MPVRALSGPVTRGARRRMGNAGRNRPHTTPAPVRGWNERDALANMKEDDAVRLDNWFPEETSVRVRRGHTEHATGLVTDVESLMSWSGPSSAKLFAGANDRIYEVTSSGAVGSADVTGLTSNRWQHVMFGTSAGNFLYIVNGNDDPRYYDGTSWTIPSITGSGLTPSDFIHVNAFKQRLFFVERQTLSFWYFSTSSVAGAATEFDLAPYCRLGGELMAMGTWTRDGGDGVDDYAVFLTSEGEVVIFQGTDPGDANNWSLVGVFQIGPPIGRRCIEKIGADLVVVTEDGFSPLSRFLASGRASEKAALSDRISGAVTEAVRDNKTRFGWQPVFYPSGNMVLFNIPTVAEAHQFVSNSTTGAWCRFTGMDANCWEVHDGDLYFGGNTKVFQADTGQDDDGSDIETDAKSAFTYLGSEGRLKKVSFLRPNLTVDGSIDVSLNVNFDFEDDHPDTTPTFSPVGGPDWDDAEWDEAEWGGGAQITKDWLSVTGIGNAASVRLKTNSQNGTIRWNATDWLWEPGGFV